MLIEYRRPSWWYWLVTVLLLAVGLSQWSKALVGPITAKLQ